MEQLQDNDALCVECWASKKEHVNKMSIIEMKMLGGCVVRELAMKMSVKWYS